MSLNLILLFLLLSLVCSAQEPQTLTQLRELFKKAAVEEVSCKKIIKMVESNHKISNPLLEGYKASATMMMAKYVFNPFTKLAYFQKGKTILEKAIHADNTNIELRFLRLAIQSNVPAFLGYKNNMSVDKAFLRQSIGHLEDQELKVMITGFLNTR